MSPNTGKGYLMPKERQLVNTIKFNLHVVQFVFGDDVNFASPKVNTQHANKGVSAFTI